MTSTFKYLAMNNDPARYDGDETVMARLRLTKTGTVRIVAKFTLRNPGHPHDGWLCVIYEIEEPTP